MPFVRRHWYSLGLAVGAVAVAWAISGRLSTVQVILVLNFVSFVLGLLMEFIAYGRLVLKPIA